MSPSALVEALELRRGDLVSLVGGGGKTTLMYRLVSELRAQGLNAAAATTTKIGPPRPEDGAGLLCAPTYEEARRHLERHGGAAVLGREVLGAGKVGGIPPEWCERLVAEAVVDVLVVEADGSARRPLKAPEAWEPVVPIATTAFVAVVGLSCLGEPLDESVVFRAERASLVSGFPLGTIITPELLAALLVAPEGLLRGSPPAARTYALLNQADTEERIRGAAEVGQRLLSEGAYRRVLTVALKEGAPLKRVFTS